MSIEDGGRSALEEHAFLLRLAVAVLGCLHRPSIRGETLADQVSRVFGAPAFEDPGKVPLATPGDHFSFSIDTSAMTIRVLLTTFAPDHHERVMMLSYEGQILDGYASIYFDPHAQ